MDDVSIIGVALVVGVIVYALSLAAPDAALGTDPLRPRPRARSLLGWLLRRPASTPEERGFGYEAAPSERGPDVETTLDIPVLQSTGPRWRARLGGVVGLMLLVTAASLALAVSIYEFGRLANQTIQGFMGY